MGYVCYSITGAFFTLKNDLLKINTYIINELTTTVVHFDAAFHV